MISIAMATYNGAMYIRQQIDSILKQTVTDFELIISDDGSTDDTYDILDSYAKSDSRIKLHRNKENHGFLANFQNAFRFCTGDYIAFCDQDDIWTNNHLEVLLQNIQNFDFVGGNAELINADGSSQNCTMRDVLRMAIVPNNSDTLFKHILIGNVFQGASCMATRELVLSNLPIPNGVQFHDYWFALMAGCSNGIKYVDKVISFYRQHNTNVTTNVAKKKSEIVKHSLNIDINRQDYELRITSRTKQIEFLKSVRPFLDDIHQKQLDDTIEYFTNINNQQMYRNRLFFKKNYEAIFLQSKKNVLLYLYRYIKHLILNK